MIAQRYNSNRAGPQVPEAQIQQLQSNVDDDDDDIIACPDLSRCRSPFLERYLHKIHYLFRRAYYEASRNDDTTAIMNCLFRAKDATLAEFADVSNDSKTLMLLKMSLRLNISHNS